MNSKTARMINRIAIITDKPEKQIKREWNRLPWNEREEARDDCWKLIAKNQDLLHSKQEFAGKRSEQRRLAWMKYWGKKRKDRVMRKSSGIVSKVIKKVGVSAKDMAKKFWGKISGKK